MKKKESRPKKETDRNRESGYHAEEEKAHIPGQHSPDEEPKHDPPVRKKKDLDRDPADHQSNEQDGDSDERRRAGEAGGKSRNTGK